MGHLVQPVHPDHLAHLVLVLVLVFVLFLALSLSLSLSLSLITLNLKILLNLSHYQEGYRSKLSNGKSSETSKCKSCPESLTEMAGKSPFSHSQGSQHIKYPSYNGLEYFLSLHI